MREGEKSSVPCMINESPIFSDNQTQHAIIASISALYFQRVHGLTFHSNEIGKCCSQTAREIFFFYSDVESMPECPPTNYRQMLLISREYRNHTAIAFILYLFS